MTKEAQGAESEQQTKPYAVLRTGAKQYRVSAGDRFAVEKLEIEVGETVSLTEVSLLGSGSGEVKIGTPLVEGASVTARVSRQFRGPKVTIFKKRRRKGYTKKQGHRQSQTELVVESING